MGTLDRVNRQVVLRHRPQGMLTHDDVEVIEGPMPECGDGEILVREVYVQMDAAVRSWLDEGEGYLPAVKIGETVRAGGFGRVIESRHPGVEVGQWAAPGLPGWQDWVAVDPDDIFVNLYPADHDALFQICVNSSSATSAYFGLKELGRLAEGDTVVVSAAAGSTGSIVVQVARILGASVIGIAGSDEKCRWVEELGAEACINRRTEDINARLKELRPKGFDIYFDNVGGETLDIALRRMGHGARIVICGAISMYNRTDRPPGPSNYLNLINRQASMVGLQGMAFAPRYPEAWGQVREWYDAGRLTFKADIGHGLETCVDQLNSLFTGSNTGKALVQLCDDPGPGPY